MCLSLILSCSCFWKIKEDPTTLSLPLGRPVPLEHARSLKYSECIPLSQDPGHSSARAVLAASGSGKGRGAGGCRVQADVGLEVAGRHPSPGVRTGGGLRYPLRGLSPELTGVCHAMDSPISHALPGPRLQREHRRPHGLEPPPMARVSRRPTSPSTPCLSIDRLALNVRLAGCPLACLLGLGVSQDTGFPF